MSDRSLLNPQEGNHLVKLLGMLGSDHDGEVAAAGRKAHEFIRRLGLTWAEVIHSPPDSGSWLQMAFDCRRHERLLSDRERDFLVNISKLRRSPSDKQLEWLVNIHGRLHQREHAA